MEIFWEQLRIIIQPLGFCRLLSFWSALCWPHCWSANHVRGWRWEWRFIWWSLFVDFHCLLLYHCEERSYNGVMAMFWGVMAIIWIWDTITGYTTFERTHKYDLLSYVLLAMPFIYPMVSLARGLSFPEMTSPVMPCSVVVFTIGLLLLFAHKVNMFLVLFLCHWSLIGLSKTYFFQIPEDSFWQVRLFRDSISSSENTSWIICTQIPSPKLNISTGY